MSLKTIRILSTIAMIFYAVSLAANFLWPLLFFGLGRYTLAFLWLLTLLVLVILTWRQFRSLDRRAGALLIPYILWLCFAAGNVTVTDKTACHVGYRCSYCARQALCGAVFQLRSNIVGGNQFFYRQRVFEKNRHQIAESDSRNHIENTCQCTYYQS